jgi:hypothetical protein
LIQSNASAESTRESRLSFRQWIIILLLFTIAFSIRLWNIDKPLLDFSPVRQYQLAHIARGYYYENLASIPEWKKRVARLNSKRMGFLLEPRIIESAAVLGYRLTGGEHIWIPRVLSSIFWLTGGWILFLIAARYSSTFESLFSTSIYLFFPFSLPASRSFQPDPLMIMMMLFSLYMIIRYFERPSYYRLIFMSIISAIALLVKPYILFLIFGAFFSLTIYKRGIKKSLFKLDVFLFTTISLLPTLIYYVGGIFSNVGFLQENARTSFLPQLLLKPYFWKDWLAMVGRVVGYFPVILGVIGIIIRKGYSRAFLIGLWIGYIVFGMTFTLHIHTHEYYHLPLIPVIALSAGYVAILLKNSMHYLLSSKLKVGLVVIIFLIITTFTGLNFEKLKFAEYKSQIKTLVYFAGVYPQFYKFITYDFDHDVKIAEKIGELVKHSTNTLFLTPYFGRVITYHGAFSGLPWPTSLSLREREERGLRDLESSEIYNKNYLTVRTHGKYIRYTPDFFIVTDFDEYERQTDLKGFLSSFPIVDKNKNYIIFDLSAMKKKDSQ